MLNCWPSVGGGGGGASGGNGVDGSSSGGGGGGGDASGANGDGGGGGDGIDHGTPVREYTLRDGDLLVMRGATQQHWHHRVPKARSRRPRINLNFRYILPDAAHRAEAERGQKTYYKYMVHGDGAMGDDGALSFDEISRRRGSILSFVAPAPATAVAPPSTGGSAPRASPPQCAHRGGSGAEAEAEEETAEWACARCTLLNPPLAPICAACDERRQVAPPLRAPLDGTSSRGVAVGGPAGKVVGSKRPAATTPSTSSSKTPRAAVARMWKL